MIAEVVSPGGIRAWLVEDHAIPILAVDFAFRGGAAQDAPDRAGTANLLTGLLDEGAGPYDSEAFHQRLEETAIELSFDVGRDVFNGGIRTLAVRTEEAFELLGHAVARAHLAPDSIERVREQVQAGLRRAEQNPEDMAARAWSAAAFPDHPYGRPVRGTAQTVAAVTRDDLEAYRSAVLTRDRLVVGAVGAIDAVTLGRYLDAVFGPLPATGALRPVPTVAPRLGSQPRITPFDVPQAVIQFGSRGIARNDPDFMAALLVNHSLGGGSFTSRLFTQVREKRGLAYSVHTSLVPLAASALLVGAVATRNERAGACLDIIRAEIAAMADEGPSPEELRRAKTFLIGSYALRFDTSAKIANQLVQIQLDGLGLDYTDRRNGLIEAVTEDDAARIARQMLGSNDLLVTVVGRPEGLA